MYNYNKAQQSKNRVHISWDILYFAHNYYAIHDDNVLMSEVYMVIVIYIWWIVTRQWHTAR